MHFEKDFYFNGEPYLPALQQIHRALRKPGACIELVGGPGVGKSSICVKVIHGLDPMEFSVVSVQRTIGSVDQLHALLAEYLGVGAATNIESALDQALGALSQPLIMIVDDSHLLGQSVLGEILRLAAGDDYELRVLLCREANLTQSVHTQSPLQAVDERLTASIDLQPMSSKQLRVFLDRFFDNSGLHGVSIEAAAQARIYSLCLGNPGAAVDLAHSLLSWCLVNPDVTALSRSHLDQALKHDHDEHQQPPSLGAAIRRLPVGRLSAMLLVAVISLVLIYQQFVGGNDSDAAIAQSDSMLAAIAPAASSPATPVVTPAPDPATNLPADLGPGSAIPAANVADVEAGSEPAEPTPVALVSPQAPDPIASDQPRPVPAATQPRNPRVRATAPEGFVSAAPARMDPRPDGLEEQLPPEPATPKAAVMAWLQAWESQQLEHYFARYHGQFQPRYQESVAAWRQNRQRVIGGAEFVRVQMRDFSVIDESDSEVEVQFWLDYESGRYRDQTLKKLVLVPGESGWQILEEVNLELRPGQ